MSAVEPQPDLSQGTTFSGKPFVVLFCFAYIFFLVASAPWAPSALKDSTTPLKNCLRRVGLVHDFVVFAPEVPSDDGCTEALVENADGTVVVWSMSNLDQLPAIQKNAAERFRKLFEERVSNVGYRAMWPDVAEYIARACATEGTVAKRVSIVRICKPIGLPPRVPAAPRVETLCTYELAAGGLK